MHSPRTVLISLIGLNHLSSPEFGKKSEGIVAFYRYLKSILELKNSEGVGGFIIHS